MTPVDGSIIAGTVYAIVHSSVKWLIPGIQALVRPAASNGNGYKVALEAVNESLGTVTESVGQVREKLAGLEPRVEVAIDEIGRLRDQVDTVPQQISDAMERVATQATTSIGNIEDRLDRRFGAVERRIETNERWIAERRGGPDDRRG